MPRFTSHPILLCAGVSMTSVNLMASESAQAMFAGGCFWCIEADFEKLPGVSGVISGFTGGSVKNPTHSGNYDGHYEAVLVPYDPKQVTYSELLDRYRVNIDPFDGGGQ